MLPMISGLFCAKPDRPADRLSGGLAADIRERGPMPRVADSCRAPTGAVLPQRTRITHAQAQRSKQRSPPPRRQRQSWRDAVGKARPVPLGHGHGPRPRRAKAGRFADGGSSLQPTRARIRCILRSSRWFLPQGQHNLATVETCIVCVYT